MEGKTTSWLLEREQFLFEIKTRFLSFLISTHKHTHDGGPAKSSLPKPRRPVVSPRAEAAPIAQARQIRLNKARSPHRYIRASWSKVSSTLGR